MLNKVTQNTPFFIVFSGAGYQSAPVGFETIKQVREVYRQVRCAQSFGGQRVLRAHIVNNITNQTIFKGRIK